MVRLNRIYTRSGDKGLTSLGDGKRVEKHCLRVQAYGCVDELNAILGIAHVSCDHKQASTANMLQRIQNELFDLGADLCMSSDYEDKKNKKRLTLISTQVTHLEKEIDRMNIHLPDLSSFILPGGTILSAHLHHARTVARRSERLVSHLFEEESGNEWVLKYLNRLSDYLFVLARWENHRGKCDVLWDPGATMEPA